MKIQAIIACFEAPDGQVAFCYTDCLTGNSVEGLTTGGVSNVSYAGRLIFDDWGSLYCYKVGCKSKEFKYLIKDMEYAGCESAKIAEFIKQKLNS